MIIDIDTIYHLTITFSSSYIMSKQSVKCSRVSNNSSMSYRRCSYVAKNGQKGRKSNTLNKELMVGRISTYCNIIRRLRLVLEILGFFLLENLLFNRTSNFLSHILINVEIHFILSITKETYILESCFLAIVANTFLRIHHRDFTFWV